MSPPITVGVACVAADLADEVEHRRSRYWRMVTDGSAREILDIALDLFIRSADRLDKLRAEYR